MIRVLSAAFQQVRHTLRRVGLKMDRLSLRNDSDLRLAIYTRDFAIDLFIDIGANDGSFVQSLLREGYRGEVISFEPLPEMWDILNEKSSRWPNWKVAPRIALGDVAGQAEFHQAGNDSSSSLLPMLDRHIQAAPTTATVRVIEVRTDTLDNVLKHLKVGAAKNIMLKIDVQGAEEKVLAGARSIISTGRVRLVKLEMSLARLYEGQSNWQDLNNKLESYGYKLWDIEPGFRDAKSGELLQFDGLYALESARRL